MPGCAGAAAAYAAEAGPYGQDTDSLPSVLRILPSDITFYAMDTQRRAQEEDLILVWACRPCPALPCPALSLVQNEKLCR